MTTLQDKKQAQTMGYRRLGRSGLNVSEIGFGTWGLGGNRGSVPAYGATDDAESLAALQKLLKDENEQVRKAAKESLN